MSNPEAEFIAETLQVQAAQDEADWQALKAGGNPTLPASPSENDPNVIQRFLAGVTKGMRETPNVFRPLAEGGEDLIARTSEVPMLPFTMAFNAVTGGLVESGIISKRTQEQLGKSLIGAIPAMTAPRGVKPAKGGKASAAEAVGGAAEVVAGDAVAAAGKVAAPVAGDVGAAVAAESRVNLARINATDQVKTVIADINAKNAERLAEHRKTQSHAETVAKSKAVTLEEALSLPDDTAKLPEQLTKLRDVHVATAESLLDVARETVKGDAAAAGKLFDAIAVASEVDIRTDITKRNIARGLESAKIGAEGQRAPFTPEQIAKTSEMVRGVQPDPVTAANHILSLKTATERMEYAKQKTNLAKAGIEAGHELYINLLLGLKSQVANFVGNSITTVSGIWERTLAAGVPGGPITMAEPLGMLIALPRGFVEGLKSAVRYGRDMSEYSKMDFAEPKIVAHKLGLGDSPYAAGFDLMGKVVRINTNLLGRGDAFFKGVNFHAELTAQAIRDAAVRGLKGKEAKEHIRYVLEHPDEFPSVVADANKFKLVQTFQDPMGPVGESLNSLRDAVPGLGRVLFPFLKTLNRVTAYAAQRTFPLNIPSVLWGEIGADLNAGGARRQLATAKLANSALITSAVAYYASQGAITGGGPRDKDVRRQMLQDGWQPYSWKIGDTYYGYNRLDPLGLTVGTIADFVEIVGEIPEADADAIAVAIMLAPAKNMVSKTYLEGWARAFEALDDPQSNAGKMAKAFAGSLVPGVVRDIEKVMDPTLREANTLIDSWKANLPGYSDSLPPRRNLKGDPVLLPPGLGPDFLSPIPVSKKGTDPVAQELVRLKVDIPMPPRAVFGQRPPQVRMDAQKASEGVELTPQEYDWLVRMAGNELKVNGKGMWDALGDLIQTDQYRRQSDGPDGGKATTIKTVVRAYREAATAKLLEESPKLAQLVEQRIRDRAEKLQPPPARSTDLLSTLGR